MGRVEYDFPSVPRAPVDEEADYQAAVYAAKGGDPAAIKTAGELLARLLRAQDAYRGIYEDLRHHGLAVPTEPPEAVSRAAVIDCLRVGLGEMIRRYLAHPDNEHLSARGETTGHLFHRHGSRAGGTRAVQHARLDHRDLAELLSLEHMGRMLARFPCGPNVITADDIAHARGK